MASFFRHHFAHPRKLCLQWPILPFSLLSRSLRAPKQCKQPLPRLENIRDFLRLAFPLPFVFNVYLSFLFRKKYFFMWKQRLKAKTCLTISQRLMVAVINISSWFPLQSPNFWKMYPLFSHRGSDYLPIILNRELLYCSDNLFAPTTKLDVYHSAVTWNKSVVMYFNKYTMF